MDRLNHYLITTLGCKVNQCESACLAASLEQRGFVDGKNSACTALVVINTCAVTARAAMQSRQAVRQAVRNHPGAAVVATGCYAQIDPEALRAIKGVNCVVGHDFKLDVDRWLTPIRTAIPLEPLTHWQPSGLTRRFDPLLSAASEQRTRAFLKIQDGCNTRCTYCVVPLARGSSRSMPVADVRNHVICLARQGLNEVVLTGIHLGAYGADLMPHVTLSDLISQLTSMASIPRLRLSSIEPTEIDPRLVEMMADPANGVCRHLHVPLQSGDDAVLQRMGRPYTGARFAQIVRGFHQALPQAAIGVDVLVGFPGEDDTAFGNTFKLIEELPVSYLHVFPYSARPGTLAAGFPDKVPPQVITSRCQRLRRLGQKKRAQFYASRIGTRTAVLVETAHDPRTGLALGTSENYLQVAVVGKAIQPNSLVTVELVGETATGALIGHRVC